jgi:hypothetical protein
MSARLVPTFADRGCHVVSMMDPYSCILGLIIYCYGNAKLNNFRALELVTHIGKLLMTFIQ